MVVKDDDYKVAFVTLVKGLCYYTIINSFQTFNLLMCMNFTRYLFYISQGDNQTFTFPDIYSAEKMEETLKDDQKTLESMKAGFQRIKDVAKTKPGLPGWFS